MALSLSPPLSLCQSLLPQTPTITSLLASLSSHSPTSTPLSFPTLPRTFHNQPISFCSCLPMPLEVSTSTAQLQDSLLYSRAYWVSESIIAWNVDVGDGHDMTIQLEEDNGGLPIIVIRPFKVPQAVDAKSLIKCQLAVAAFS
ncbi:Pullulanase 1, chloroplastic [Vitis vinifera]|uniref:Pullulanase 1, chloroplastic n=1 Tax=Vitis vinifera TaxID=29760 RepID=A0A438ILU7_VITVI|nr:Pullulanase 1, chloroplastic [Vitis vinifera]